ncbi:hypothetical protein LUZ61_012702 [Rhynchospora tenuis]|uniref:Uncharacterized protein n=1 Tax=Rhynchospora tenuis TaxID=198213 RepID=A0AAD6A3G2_9POAL|nr:hypothetical protein LUZ61_012702 [Rhynchospora tenuis]
MASLSPTVRTIETYAVNPRPNPQTPRQLHLSPWDVGMLTAHYIQKGLLFAYPPDLSVDQIIQLLRSSLEEALFHFYPLSRRLRVVTCVGGGVRCHVELGCQGEGAEFVHAVADGIGIADVVAVDGQDLPMFIKEFFPLDSAFNFDGSGKEVVLSRPPVHDRWFIGGYGEPPIRLPYSSPTEFVVRSSTSLLRERIFHFSNESLAKLKARANQEFGEGTISTFQDLSALMWRCITRARSTPKEQITGELLDNNLGWAAWLVHQLVKDHTVPLET